MRTLVAIALAACSSDAPAGEAPTPPETPQQAQPAPQPASPPRAAQFTAELVRIAHPDGPWQGSEQRRVGEESTHQHLVVRVRNGTARRAGGFDYDLFYVDAAGSPLAIDTNLGRRDHDHSRMVGPSVVVEPGQTRELSIVPNYGPIPKGAARAELRFTAVYELTILRDGFELGAQIWP